MVEVTPLGSGNKNYRSILSHARTHIYVYLYIAEHSAIKTPDTVIIVEKLHSRQYTHIYTGGLNSTNIIYIYIYIIVFGIGGGGKPYVHISAFSRPPAESRAKINQTHTHVK